MRKISLVAAFLLLVLGAISFQAVAVNPPVADADGPYSGVVGTLVTFDASGSYHPDSSRTIVLYEWDFDNDGVYDYSGLGPIASHAFPLDMMYIVSLRVTDDIGLTDSTSTTANIVTGGQAAIEAHKWEDSNFNEIQDAGEPDIEGWLMTIYSSNNGGQTWTYIAEGYTGSDGTVTFAGLPAPLLYKVIEEESTNWFPTTDSFFTVNAEQSSDYAFEFGNAYIPTHVIPEVPYGTVMALLTCFAALVIMKSKRININL